MPARCWVDQRTKCEPGRSPAPRWSRSSSLSPPDCPGSAEPSPVAIASQNVALQRRTGDPPSVEVEPRGRRRTSRRRRGPARREGVQRTLAWSARNSPLRPRWRVRGPHPGGEVRPSGLGRRKPAPVLNGMRKPVVPSETLHRGRELLIAPPLRVDSAAPLSRRLGALCQGLTFLQASTWPLRTA